MFFIWELCIGKMIEIEKQIERTIPRDVFYYQLTLDIDKKDLQYLKSKIDKGIKEKGNMSGVTNVKGNMTPWLFFSRDEVFQKYLKIAFDTFNNQGIRLHVGLKEAWGVRVDKKQWTAFHDHDPNWLAGILYLSDTDLPIIFKDINVQTKPKVGKFIVWSGYIHHGNEEKNPYDSKYAIAFNCSEIKTWE